MSTRKLGRYLMGETLGKGGFSKVRLGVDEATGERVALKILKKKEMGITADVIKQVEREIHAMQLIRHQNVLQLKDVQWDCTYEKKNGTRIPVILVVLELAQGGELFDFLSFTGPFEEAIARTYFQQLMAGIAHCHAKGIAHRDIKPENLLLSDNFVLKLADFGFAASFAGATAAHQAMYTECGTPGYMAPEVFSSGKGFDRKGYDGAAADIWSCGVVLFIQLAGFPPFQRPALNDWWFHKLYHGKHHLFWEAHQRTAYFSDLVKDFLNKLLCPDPARRLRMEELLAHPWVLGPTVSHGALQAELQRRKQAVDEAKGAERAQKEAAALKAEGECAIPAQAGLLERGDVSMTRGHAAPVIDALSEALPPVNPSITSFAQGLQPAPKVGDGNGLGEAEAAQSPHAGAVMSADAFASGEGGERYEGEEGEGEQEEQGEPGTAEAAQASASSATSEPLAPLFPSIVVRSFTRFNTVPSVSAGSLFSTITSTLESVGCTLQLNRSKWKVKRARCVTSVGVIEFSVSLYRDPNAAQSHIVDFQRLSSDSAQFRTLYAELRLKLRHIIADAPSETLRDK